MRPAMRAPPGVGVWILLGVLWLASLPLRPLFDPDEGRYAEIPREMAASADWVTPTLNGLKYFEKPPLQYWATAALYSVFGAHDWTGRAWATTLAFLCIPLVFCFALRIGYARDTAWVAASLLAINPYFALTGQLNLLDQGFTFFLTAAVFGFVLAQRESQSPPRARRWMLVTSVALALAVLSKGIVALALAGGSVVLYTLIQRDFSPLRRLHLTWTLPAFALVVVPWFWLIQGRNPEFARFFFIHEHFERFLTANHDHVEPWWYFGPIMLIALLPVIWNLRSWSLLDHKAALAGCATAGFDAQRFLLIWCGLVLVLFSFSQSKLSSYVMPMMPALAVVLARPTELLPAAWRRATVTLVVIQLIAAAGVVLSGWRRAHEIQPAAIGWACAVLALILIFALHTRSRAAQDSLRWPALAALSIAGYQCLFMCYAAAFPARSSATLAAQVRESLSPRTQVYSVGQFRHSLTFYLPRTVAIFDYSGELAFGMRQAGKPPEGADRAEFLRAWRDDTDAIAFIDPKVYALLAAQGMPGRVIAQDAHSVVVDRS